mmetsp:Transcript_981/g.2337  ORF Transcript_981/g.2337 Transcript_981/m.2337 type:complete len:250 (+) Transcript_981:1017-1766(+)
MASTTDTQSGNSVMVTSTLFDPPLMPFSPSVTVMEVDTLVLLSARNLFVSAPGSHLTRSAVSRICMMFGRRSLRTSSKHVLAPLFVFTCKRTTACQSLLSFTKMWNVTSLAQLHTCLLFCRYSMKASRTILTRTKVLSVPFGRANSRRSSTATLPRPLLLKFFSLLMASLTKSLWLFARLPKTFGMTASGALAMVTSRRSAEMLSSISACMISRKMFAKLVRTRIPPCNSLACSPPPTLVDLKNHGKLK